MGYIDRIVSDYKSRHPTGPTTTSPSSGGGGSGGSGGGSTPQTTQQESNEAKAKRFGSKSGYVIVQTSKGYQRVHVSEVDSSGNYSGGSGGTVYQQERSVLSSNQNTPTLNNKNGIVPATTSIKTPISNYERMSINPFVKKQDTSNQQGFSSKDTDTKFSKMANYPYGYSSEVQSVKDINEKVKQQKEERLRTGTVQETKPNNIFSKLTGIIEQRNIQKKIFSNDTKKETVIRDNKIVGTIDVKPQSKVKDFWDYSLTESERQAIKMAPFGVLASNPSLAVAGANVLKNTIGVAKGTIAKTVQPVVNKLPTIPTPKNALLKGGLDIIKGTTILSATTYGTTQVSKKIGKETAPQEQKRLMQDNKRFNELMMAGWESERESLKDKGFIQRYGNEIPLVPLWYGNETAFQKGVNDYATNVLGLKPNEAETLAQATLRQRKAGLIGEGTGIFLANVGSELIGQSLVGTKFKSSSLTKIPKGKFFSSGIFKRVFPEIAKAGVAEGLASELATEVGRYEKISPKKLLLAGGLGGLSAGIVGGLIGGFAVTKPAISKTILGGAYITDPFEYPGDVTAGFLERSLKLPISTPVIIDTSRSKAPTIQLGVKSPSVTKTSTKTTSKTPSQIMNNILTGTPTSTPTNVPTIFPTITPTPTGVPSYVPISPTIPTDIPTNIPTDIPIQIPADVPSQVPTDIPTMIPTNIPITISTPVVRPYIPPPILPLIPPISLGSGAGIGSKGRRKKYENELSYGLNLIGGKLFAKKSVKVKSKRTKSTRKKQLGLFPEFRGLGNFKMPEIKLGI